MRGEGDAVEGRASALYAPPTARRRVLGMKDTAQLRRKAPDPAAQPHCARLQWVGASPLCLLLALHSAIHFLLPDAASGATSSYARSAPVHALFPRRSGP